MERGILPAFVAMLGAVLVAMMMLGSSHTQAQTTGAQTTTQQAQLTAKRRAQVSGTTTTLMTGSVEIVIPGGAKITADEANVDRQTGVVDLRGNVRLVLPPATLSR